MSKSAKCFKVLTVTHFDVGMVSGDSLRKPMIRIEAKVLSEEKRDVFIPGRNHTLYTHNILVHHTIILIVYKNQLQHCTENVKHTAFYHILLHEKMP